MDVSPDGGATESPFGDGSPRDRDEAPTADPFQDPNGAAEPESDGSSNYLLLSLLAAVLIVAFATALALVLRRRAEDPGPAGLPTGDREREGPPPSDGSAGTPSSTLAPGWYEHPEHPTVQRYWDGSCWTGEHRFAPPDWQSADTSRGNDEPPTRPGAGGNR